MKDGVVKVGIAPSRFLYNTFVTEAFLEIRFCVIV